ncbi:MAG: biopolymer transporter ExbD [Candidatus Omnitrophica bacterium]|nr:biopolymer transporter ExbD [Candidatus Omnitrophota bacterium]
MKFRRHMELEHGLKQIDIAPLIDVVFQLLIFFMLTSSFVMQPGIKVNLPKAVTSQVIEEENLVITVSSENVIYINEKVISLNELKDLLNRFVKKGKAILIKSDRRASLGRVVEVWDMCRESGISQVNIATNQE